MKSFTCLHHKLASEINTEGKLNLSHEDFVNLCYTLAASGGKKNVARVSAFLKTLHRDELIVRISAVSRLYNLLSVIKSNYNAIPIHLPSEENQSIIGKSIGYICLCHTEATHIIDRLQEANIISNNWIIPEELDVYNLISDVPARHTLRLSKVNSRSFLFYLYPIDSKASKRIAAVKWGDGYVGWDGKSGNWTTLPTRGYSYTTTQTATISGGYAYTATADQTSINGNYSLINNKLQPSGARIRSITPEIFTAALTPEPGRIMVFDEPQITLGHNDPAPIAAPAVANTTTRNPRPNGLSNWIANYSAGRLRRR